MINFLTEKVRQVMLIVAAWLDRTTNSKISPNFVTLVSLLGHLFVILEIVRGQLVLAAILLTFFGLMDALDGALAKVQNKTSLTGMLFDASSDRVKEFLLYLALIFVFAADENLAGVVAATIALGGSFMVSYIKAKGETAIVASTEDHKKVNRVFAIGIMQYQVRMFILIVGLLTGFLTLTVTIIGVMSWLTALFRLIDIKDSLQPKAK